MVVVERAWFEILAHKPMSMVGTQIGEIFIREFRGVISLLLTGVEGDSSHRLCWKEHPPEY